jgi:phosphoribosyl 1,2-cyclic phosphate phosphodiesterase
MQIVFLGTGAAEGVPAAYCRCEICQGVRARRGVEIKTRSSLRIGESHQIDLTPDYYAQTLAAGLDMCGVEHLLVTHTHEDHFSLPGLLDARMAREESGQPLAVYLSQPGRDYVEALIAAAPLSGEDRRWIASHLVFVGLEHFREYRIGALAVHTVTGNHPGHGANEQAVGYLVGLPGGKSLLYACDTGYFAEPTWECLSGRRVDALIVECTFGGRTDRGEFPANHLDLASFLRTLERMSRIGFIDERTAVYATHICPHQSLSHFELDRRLRDGPHRAAAAYDGLRFEL